MKNLKVVPVSISYEYDPCAFEKAHELHQKSSTGRYEKTEFEDIESIRKGIVGRKGKVIVTFGDVIDANCETPDEMVAEVDRQIISQYAIQSTNKAALKMLNGEPCDDAVFEEYMATCPDALRETVLRMYANPLLQQQERQFV